MLYLAYAPERITDKNRLTWSVACLIRSADSAMLELPRLEDLIHFDQSKAFTFTRFIKLGDSTYYREQQDLIYVCLKNKTISILTQEETKQTEK